MTTTPKPTPPPARYTCACGARCNDVADAPSSVDNPCPVGGFHAWRTTAAPPTETLGHIAAALALLAEADLHGEDARTARSMEQHSLAGQFRERERMCLKRAELLVSVAQADALSDIADAARRIALAL